MKAKEIFADCLNKVAKNVPAFAFLLDYKTDTIVHFWAGRYTDRVINKNSYSNYLDTVLYPHDVFMHSFWEAVLRESRPSFFRNDVQIRFRYKIKDGNGKSRIVEQTSVPLDHQPFLCFCFCYLINDPSGKLFIPFTPVIFQKGQRLSKLETKMKMACVKSFLNRNRHSVFFSKREQELLMYLGDQGGSSRELALAFNLSVETIRSHHKNILMKGRVLFGESFQTVHQVAEYMAAIGGNT